MRHAEAYGAAASDSWLSKNRDQLLPTLAVALAASESPLLASLFEREGMLAQDPNPNPNPDPNPSPSPNPNPNPSPNPNLALARLGAARLGANPNPNPNPNAEA